MPPFGEYAPPHHGVTGTWVTTEAEGAATTPGAGVTTTAAGGAPGAGVTTTAAGGAAGAGATTTGAGAGAITTGGWLGTTTVVAGGVEATSRVRTEQPVVAATATQAMRA